MKIRLLTKTLLAVALCSSAFASHHDVEADRSWNSEHRYAVSIDPIGWTSGNFRAQLEASMNDRLSFNMPIGFGFKEAIFKNDFKGSYFAPKFGVKYYITGKAAHQGFYVNPLLGLFIGKVADVTGVTNDTFGGFTYGFRMGYAWNIWKGLWLDSYLGYEALATNFSDKDNASLGSEKFVKGTNLNAFNAAMMLGYNW